MEIIRPVIDQMVGDNSLPYYKHTTRIIHRERGVNNHAMRRGLVTWAQITDINSSTELLILSHN